ncbi:hypothetical protein Y032_0089g2220 [Ancylostoma ceylanicum]|uniref:Uncharacterized protein n=1 Tax=Ancylostoma ceylanicum TaxID=53326 RepID=A0A016TNT5_9BILA|nr:hypothetical protein Y032_0089g2220 [Ancylostoma ceylanicum]
MVQKQGIPSSTKFMHFENIVGEGSSWRLQSRQHSCRGPRIAILVVIEADTGIEFYKHAMCKSSIISNGSSVLQFFTLGKNTISDNETLRRTEGRCRQLCIFILMIRLRRK